DGKTAHPQERERDEAAAGADLQVLVVGEVGERAPVVQWQILLRPSPDDRVGGGNPVGGRPLARAQVEGRRAQATGGRRVGGQKDRGRESQQQQRGAGS